MLIVKSDALKTAYTEILERLLSDSKKYDDPELFRENTLIAHVQNGHDFVIPITYTKRGLQENFPYEDYFPHISKSMIEQEMLYWNQQFFEANKLPELIQYLRLFPLSKRGIILFWDDKYRDLSRSSICEVAVFFRIKNGLLEMHSHMRANNAAFLLFMDMRILMGVQRIVAKELGIGVGDYIHFVDSLHIYEVEKDLATKQSKLITASPLWQAL